MFGSGTRKKKTTLDTEVRPGQWTLAGAGEEDLKRSG